jgi:hypothetical protein
VTPAFRAGALYAAALFGIGFALALVRIPVLQPHIGETAAVLVELPIMLAAAWFVARALLARTPLPPAGRVLMGAVYFPLLLLLELSLGLALGGAASAIIEGWFHVPGALGLAAQALAAAFPRLIPAR